MKRRGTLTRMTLLLTGLLWGQEAAAGYKALQHSAAANGVALGPVLVAPTRDDMSLRIKRIRISTTASATTPSYRFYAKNSSTKEGGTVALGSCTLPDCVEVLAAEAVTKGNMFDYDGLDFTLLPGDRLAFYATADVSSESKHATLEVWYDEVPVAGR